MASGYIAARDLKDYNPVGAFLQARDAAQQNALMQRRQTQDEQQQAAAQQNALFNQNRLTQQDATQAQAAQQQQSAAQEQAQLKQAYVGAQRVAAAPVGQRRQVAIAALGPEGIAHYAQKGMDVANMSEDEIGQLAQYIEAEVGGKLGIAPTAAPKVEPFTLSPGQQRFGPDGTPIASVAAAPDKPSATSLNRIRTMSPQEIAAAGLQPGTSAQIDSNGKIDILSKRDNTGALSQKDLTTAKMKINTVNLARQQLNKIKEAFDEGRQGMNAFGPGQGLLPTQAGKKFDARVNQMRSTLTALTRVPGVGAMSDYETKLDQSKFPSRTAYESVTADTITNLEDQLALIENGYRSLLSGGAPEPAASATPSAPAAGGWSVKRVN